MGEHAKLFGALAVVALAIYVMVDDGDIDRPPGRIAPDEPTQSVIQNGDAIVTGDYTLLPRARFELQARVMSAERYRIDAGADLAPIDLALGWGEMSDSQTLQHFRVTQAARFFTIYPDEQSIDIPTALRQSANMHLIPGDASVRKTLLRARIGNVVKLSGYLVSASRADGFTWNSSMTRDDTGAGACELMYVQSASLW